MGNQHCRAVPVASSDYCEITRCQDCGNLHLSIGSLTLRLPLQAVSDLHNCIQSALVALGVEHAATETRNRPAHH